MLETTAVSQGGEATLHKALDEAASAGEEERDQQAPREGAGNGGSLLSALRQARLQGLSEADKHASVLVQKSAVQ